MSSGFNSKMWKDLSDEECKNPVDLFTRQHLKNVRAWVISDDVRDEPRYAPLIQWVRDNARDITSELNARSKNPDNVEVFVRR